MPGLVVGIGLFTGLVVYHGVGDLYAALAGAGAGILLIAAVHALPLALDAAGWRAVLPPAERPAAGRFVVGRWLAVSINTLLPAMQVGGNVVRAQWLARGGVAGPVAGASVVVDVTTTVLSQVLFAAMGAVIAVAAFGGGDLARVAFAGLALLAAGVAGFWQVQRRGVFGGLSRLLGGAVPGGDPSRLTANADALDAAVGRLWAGRRPIVASIGWHLASWVVGSAETWLALAFLGHPMPLVTALMLESLAQVVRSSAFAVPAALGVQEAGYVLLGRTVGLDADTGLALSLVRRARDLLVGVPGLCVWWLDSAALLPQPAAPSHHPGADPAR